MTHKNKYFAAIWTYNEAFQIYETCQSFWIYEQETSNQYLFNIHNNYFWFKLLPYITYFYECEYRDLKLNPSFSLKEKEICLTSIYEIKPTLWSKYYG